MKAKRETLSAAWLQPPAGAAPKLSDVWEDLLAKLTPAVVEQTGHGWRMEKDELFSPDAKWAVLPVPGKLSGTSYLVRGKLRQLIGKEVFHIVLPVTDRMCGFDLEGGRHFGGIYTGLILVNGRNGRDLPGLLVGKQVNDSEPHDLEVTVRLDGANANVTATLDTRSLYAEVPPATKRSPFRYHFNKDYAQVFLRIRDGLPGDNPGAAVYSIKPTP